MTRIISIEGFNAAAKTKLLQQLREKCVIEKKEKYFYTVGIHLLNVILCKIIFGNTVFASVIATFYLSCCITYYMYNIDNVEIAELFSIAKKFNFVNRDTYEKKSIVFLDEPSYEWCNDERGKNIQECVEQMGFAFYMLSLHEKMNILAQAIEKYPNSTIVMCNSIITDRVVFIEALHEFGKLSHIEFQVYNKWFQSIFSCQQDVFKNVQYIYIDQGILAASPLRTNQEGMCHFGGASPHDPDSFLLENNSVVEYDCIGSFHKYCIEKYEDLFLENEPLLKICLAEKEANISDDIVSKALKIIRGN